jgi:divalent metal cation (Fe/Co/Zn/Cd) transporter
MLLVAISGQNDSADRGGTAKRAVMLAAISVAWGVVEAVVAVTAGIFSGSISLVAFGASSAVEVVSLAIVLWAMMQVQRQHRIDPSHTATLRSALFIAGIGFLLLALAVVHEAGSMLFYREQAGVSVVGIVLAALSLVAKPVLARVKRRTAAAPQGTIPAIDTVSTALSSTRSLILLLGLCASAVLHWRWADPAAALLMLPLILRQGWKAIEESKEHSEYRTRLDRAER